MYGANVIIFEGIFSFYNVDVMKVSRRAGRKAGTSGVITDALRYESESTNYH